MQSFEDINKLKIKLDKNGHLFLPKWKPEMDTKEVALKFGILMEISELEEYKNIPNVQRLTPSPKDATKANKYSGHFGMDDFPLHTDLAHWLRPPHYLLLRCVKGSDLVSTRLLPKSVIDKFFQKNFSRKAVFRTRYKKYGSKPLFLPLYFSVNGEEGIRWDSLFILPVNDKAKTISKFLLSSAIKSEIIEYFLKDPGDTLVINNWSMLHGRSSINQNANDRLIERTYVTKMENLK